MTSLTVSLREITRDTLRPILDLNVAESQQGFVAPNARSIAEAHFEGDKAWFRAIYADETPVGFVMLYIDREKSLYYLWRLMIGENHQGRGYGLRAMQQVIDFVRSQPDAKELMVSYVPGDGNPSPFYVKLGFEETGRVEDGERVMRLALVGGES